MKGRDKWCKVSDYPDALESDHLIPREEKPLGVSISIPGCFVANPRIVVYEY